MTQEISTYTALLTSQYQIAEKFIQWLTVPLQMLNDISRCADSISTYFNIDTAAGVQLDLLGQEIGLSRTLPFEPTEGSSPLMDDETYRKVLKLKSSFNYWNGQVATIYEVWNAIFPDVELIITDNQDMSADVSLIGELSQIFIDMIYNDFIIPRPEGVQYNFGGTTAVAPIFAFDYEEGESIYYEGFDIGYWDNTFI